MAKAAEVLGMLCPNTEYTVYSENYEDIVWNNPSEAISKKDFEKGFEQYDQWKLEKETADKIKRETALAKLSALGLTTDDLSALGL